MKNDICNIGILRENIVIKVCTEIMEGTASFLYGMYGIERYLYRVQNMIHDWLQGNVENIVS